MATATYPCPNCRQPIPAPAGAASGAQVCPHCRTPHAPPAPPPPEQNVAHCPNCNQQFIGAGRLAGRMLTCPQCQLVFRVPKGPDSKFRRIAIQASLAGVITGVIVFGVLGWLAAKKRAAQNAIEELAKGATPVEEVAAGPPPVEPVGCFTQALQGGNKLLVVVMRVPAARLAVSEEDYQQIATMWDKSRRDPFPQGPNWLRVTDPNRFSLTTSDNLPRNGEVVVFQYDTPETLVTERRPFQETREAVQFDPHESVTRAIGWTVAPGSFPPYRVWIDDDKPTLAPLRVQLPPQYPLTLDLQPEKMPALPQPVLPDGK